MTPPLVSIIIVTYNSASYLKACLDSILKTSYPNKEIIVVDNNSSDKTMEALSSYQKKIKIINTGNNLGYAEANNIGIKESGGKYCLLINPDTAAEIGFLEPLVKEVEKDKKVGAAQPLVKLMRDKRKINLTGKVTHYLGFDWVKDFLKEKPPEKGEIYSFSGCGVLFSREIINKIGLYDPSYFMYYEDTDLSWRMKLMGYKIFFIPESIIYHDYKYIPKENYQPLKRKLYYNERNRLITLLKNYSLRTLLVILPILIFIELSMVIFSLFSGWFKEKVQGYCSIINLRNEIVKKRKFIQQNRLLVDKQIVDNFVDRLNFGMFNRFEVKAFINPILYLYWKVTKNLI